MDVIAYHRHLASKGALGPLGLFGARGVSAYGLAPTGQSQPGSGGSFLDPALRRQLKKDGWSDKKLEAVFG